MWRSNRPWWTRRPRACRRRGAASRRIAPLEEQERELPKQQAGREKAPDDAVSMQRKIDDSLRAKKDLLAQRDQDVEKEGNELILQVRTRATREVTREKLRAELEAAQVREADTLKLMPNINRNCHAARDAVDQLTGQKSDVDEEVGKLSQRCEQLRNEVSLIKKDLDGLHDFKQMYKHRMAKHGDPMVRQALQALEWLDSNRERLRQTGQLRGEVYGLVAMHCSVADPACGAMLENAIPMNKLMGFVAENDQDLTRVKLKRVGNYSDYELQLMVRFRDNTEFSELDDNKHSGGERAMSTVMFLMALQDMTTSPFRVVDEVNQGMDESNERLVFDRVVKSCCGDASKPQYFLVTPKLLQGQGVQIPGQ